MWMLLTISFLLLLTRSRPLRVKSAPVNAPGYECYSCMSRYYGVTWKFLGYSRIYIEPRAFTDDCGDPTAQGTDVPYTTCQDTSNCVTLIEDIRMGVGAKGFIRGCYGNIFLFGFNRTSSAFALSNHEFCHTYNISQLIAGGRPAESQIRACACAGNRCNDHSISTATQSHSFSSYVLLFLIILLPFVR